MAVGWTLQAQVYVERFIGQVSFKTGVNKWCQSVKISQC